MEEIVKQVLEESIRVKETFIRENLAQLILLSEKIAGAFTVDRKLMLCGNGGSAADAQHLAAEFVNRYTLERPPLPALALTTDTSVITSIANDYSFDQLFVKQIKALGMKGDVLLVLSTSGDSPNILEAVKAASGLGIYTAGLLGSGGGKLRRMVDLALVVDSQATPRVQESHILAGHLICHLVDYVLFQSHLEAE
jgi:D-sedoheptulose 7-phosphate isomerase